MGKILNRSKKVEVLAEEKIKDRKLKTHQTSRKREFIQINKMSSKIC